MNQVDRPQSGLIPSRLDKCGRFRYQGRAPLLAPQYRRIGFSFQSQIEAASGRNILYKPARISTRCPQCAGELSFDEGSNAVQCRYCDSPLLVTGYDRILSYFLEPRMGEDHARRVALQSLSRRGDKGKGRVRGIRLAFVPFYRLTGLDFAWSWRHKEIASPLLPSSSTGLPLRLGGEELYASELSALPPLKEKEYRLTSNYLDRTFLAANLPSLPLLSLGVRSQVLTLHLFDPQELSPRGQIIPVAMDWREAWDRPVCLPAQAGVRTGGAEQDLTLENLTRRRIINRILSLIFFPIWEVQVEANGGGLCLLLDGIAQSLLAQVASPLFSESLAESSFSAQTLRFRPLCCPNCAGPLPVEPNFRLFSCSTCHRVWQIQGDEFQELPYRLAQSPRKPESPHRRFLPFWIFQGQVHLEGKMIASKYDLAQIAPLGRLPKEEEKRVPLRFFIPAFKLRDLAVVNRLSSSFTRMQPLFQTQEPSGEPLHPGGVLDQEEAANFAHLALISVVPKGNHRLVERVAQAQLTLSPGELVFFPFEEELHSLREDFLGTAIHRNTLR